MDLDGFYSLKGGSPWSVAVNVGKGRKTSYCPKIFCPTIYTVYTPLLIMTSLAASHVLGLYDSQHL
jgi:hypothetical protein